MPEIHDYWLFVATGILLNLTPGQDSMFIIGRSLSGGRRAGIAAAFGIATGSLCHTIAAAIGLSALLMAAPVAFTAVRLAGAVYLIYLGVRLLGAKAAPLPQDMVETKASSAFVQGVLTNVLNPKVALFFFALLPQFITPAGAGKPLPFLALGATFIITGTLWCLVLAVAAARLRALFIRRPGVRTWLDRTTGALFLGLGLRLAWSR